MHVGNKFKILLKVISGIGLIFLAWFVFLDWKIDRGDFVEYNGEWYTRKQLAKIVPPQTYHVESKNKPEDVYANFREALLAGDQEKALSYIVEKNREKYREAFKGRELMKVANLYPDVITKKFENGNFCIFVYKFKNGNQNIDSSVEFVKNMNGYWEIEQI